MGCVEPTMEFDTERIPVPADHAPRKDSFQEPAPDSDKLAVMERDNENAWMTCENPWDVKA